MLLSRYGDISFVLNSSVEDGLLIIEKAKEKREEQKAWGMWLVKYQNMDKDNFIPFSEFYKKATTPAYVSKRSVEDILKDAQEIQNKIKASKSQS